MTAEVAGVEKELSEYVAMRRRVGEVDFRFEDALIGHRRQAVENLLDSGESFWVERIRVLDQIAGHKGISLAGERGLKFVTDELAERERLLRAEEIARRRTA